MSILPTNERRKITNVVRKKVWVFGAPFSGKTTFANAFPDPLMLNTDGNYEFVDAPVIPIKDEVKKNGRMTERKMAWEIFKEVITELELKQNTFKTIVVDLLEDTYEHCRLYMYQQMGITHESDDSFRAWDKVRTEFLSTMKRLTNLDYENIILISHVDTAKDITKKGGDKVTAIRPNLQDKISNKLAGMVDIVARAIADDGQYVLSFKRNEVIFGGGRLKFKTQEIPLDYNAFCNLYSEANTNIIPMQEKPVETQVVSSDTQKVPCEDTNEVEEETSSEPVISTETDTANVDNESAPVRRRKRRTEQSE